MTNKQFQAFKWMLFGAALMVSGASVPLEGLAEQFFILLPVGIVVFLRGFLMKTE